MADDKSRTHGRFSDIDYIQWLSGEIMGLARHNRAQLGRGPSDDPLTWSGGVLCERLIDPADPETYTDVRFVRYPDGRYLSDILLALSAEADCANADITITVSAIVKPKGAAHG